MQYCIGPLDAAVESAAVHLACLELRSTAHEVRRR